MPLINVKLMEGVFTQGQKQEMIRKLTDAMVSIEGEHMRPVTLVVILLALLYLGLRRIGHEIAVYVGFDEGVVDEQ